MMHKVLLVISAVSLLVLGSDVFAQPTSVSYQGELLKDGVPWDGNANFKFAIVSGGANLWSNDGTATGQPVLFVTLEVNQGIFSALLGVSPMDPLTADLLDGVTNAQLRVWVDTGDGFEQLSDQPMASSAFALVAAIGADAGTTFMAIGGEAFTARDSSYRVRRGSTFGTCATDPSAGPIEAPVLLPDGAQILSMTAYYWDETSASDITIYMQRMNLSNGGIQNVASVTSSGSAGSGSGTDDAIFNGLVDNSQYVFATRVTTTAGWVFTAKCELGVRGVVIEYSLP